MKKSTIVILAVMLFAGIALNTSAVKGLMNWLSTPSTTRAEIAGKDGVMTVMNQGTVLNKYAVLANDAPAGSPTITIANAGGSNGLDPASLTAGDVLFIIQMSGATIDTSDTPNFGMVTALNNAGRYEFVTVSTVTGNTVNINPPCGGLRYGYTASEKVQVIRVPQYTTLTIAPGASLTAPPWDGNSGGVIAIHVQNNAVIDGTVEASEAGYRGAALVMAGGGGFRTDYRSTQQDFGALKGEGIAGYGMALEKFGGQYGRGAAANGGGGGTAHNSGGGGGANGTNGSTWNGQGVMDGSVTGAAAWQLDPGYIANGNALTNSSGGGRGGYSYSINDQNALTTPPGNSSWGADFRREVGGLGGRPVQQDLSGRIFMGGGGGAGAQNNNSGGAGGNGGGLIFLIAKNVSGSGMFKANGAGGGDTRLENRDGAGGGGAGGTIIIAAETLSGVTAQARGGRGGRQMQPTAPALPTEAEGPGGGGGGGYIGFAGGTITTDISGGAQGTTSASALAEFTPNGATGGSAGKSESGLPIGTIPFCQTTTDLSITKTNNQNAVVPGAPVTYTIVAKNNGLNDVFGVSVTDTIPPVFSGVTWTCTASAGSACLQPTGSGSINAKVNLISGGTATFLVTGTPNPSATGNVVNTAIVTIPDGAVDPNPNNNSATDDDPFTPQADLTILKSNGTSTVVAGTSTTYNILVTNNGPSAVTGAIVSDTLPPALTAATWVCSASVGGSCGSANGSGNINATVSLLPGATANFTVTGTIATNATGTIVNTATVSVPQGVTELIPSNNTSTDTDTINQAADLSITKTNNTTTVVAGTQTTYTVVVTNNGPSAVTGAQVNDTLPAQLSNASWTCTASAGSGCGTANGTGDIAALVNLLPGGTATFSVTATVLPGATGTVSNTVTVATPNGTNDPTPGNNTGTDTDTVTSSADLAITKVAGSASGVPGMTISYTIEVTNNGPSNVTGATVTDTLPATLTNATWACTATAGSSCGAASGSGNINSTVNLLTGGKATYSLTAKIVDSASGTIVNQASVTPPAGTTDNVPGNNNSSSTTPVAPESDLRITKTASAASIRAGDELVYTLTATNLGPSTATNVQVTDTIVDTVTIVSAQTTKGSCSVNGQNVTCSIGSLSAVAPNDTAVVTIRVRVPFTFPVGPLPNSAVVSSETPDKVPGNNTSTTTTTITEPPGARFTPVNILVRNTATDACIGSGNVLSVEVRLTNSGDGVQNDNPGPELVAALPVQLTGVAGSCSTTGGSCTVGATQIEWNGTIQPGQSVTITYQVRVRQGVDPGTRFCTDIRVNYDSNSDNINDMTTVVNNCLTANCVPPPCSGPDCPGIGPGIEFDFSKQAVSGDDKPGSMLIFPFYISDPTSGNIQNTRISITNIEASRPAYIHLFFIDGSSCAVADNFLCLTPNQTTTFLLSDFDPGISGYIIALAVDNLGRPTNFNYLIGDEYIKMSSGHSANLGAEAVAAIDLPQFDPTNGKAVINLDGLQYTPLGRVVSADSIPSVADGNSTLLILDRIGGDLSVSGSLIGSVFGLLYDDIERPFSFSFNQSACQFRTVLSSSFPRSLPRFPEVVPAGRTGWMKMWMQNEGALVGATITANNLSLGYRGGRNLHKLTLANTSLTIPIFAPSCQ